VAIGCKETENAKKKGDYPNVTDTFR